MATAETAIEPRERRMVIRKERKGKGVNVGRAERWISMMGGSILALYGLTRRSRRGRALSLLGSYLLVSRGRSGHCPLYGALGVSTAGAAAAEGISMEKSVIINRPREEVYRFWRNFENLPRFMRHLESVRSTDGRSHWVVREPGGITVEWDAEMTEDRENEFIAWHTLENADIRHKGKVMFSDATGGRGTEVRVKMKYRPPLGALGAAAAKLLTAIPKNQLEEDLRNFKQVMEAGEIPTTEGQPSGRQRR
ncbi:MAG: SRPBCC family protein [Nitrospirota bacterium]